MKTKTKTIAPDSGYRPCACRDCMEIAIGEPGAYCHECDDAGCPDYQGQTGMSQECQAPGAYGGEEEGDDDDGLEPPVSRIAEVCRTEGAYPIARLTSDPPALVTALLGVLRELAPEALPGLASIPAEALADGLHPAWNGGPAEAALCALMLAINAAAPDGFALIMDGESVGFFPLAGEGI